MITDRMRVEAGIIPSLIYGICHNLKDIQETEEQRNAHSLIIGAAFKAMTEPVEDLLPNKAAQILRRSERAYLDLAKVLDGASNVQAMMAVYYLLEGLLQEERLTIYEDSYLGNALDVYMKAIESYWSEQRLDEAAQKKGRKMREKLREEGYFK